MKKVLFGAGVYATKAIEIIGKDNIAYIVDNDKEKSGKVIDNIVVYSFEEKMEDLKSVEVIISVSQKYLEEILSQLKNYKIPRYRTFQEIQVEYTKTKILNGIDYLDIYRKSIKWIEENSVNGEAIICNTGLVKGYPEVTGYYIPTLIRWGYRDKAIAYAKWLCEIQKEDGSWYDTNDKNPYVFDTAQILKGLISIRDIYPFVDVNIKRGCEWILSNMLESGQLTTPTKEAWGAAGVCSELIHLYCLSPLVDAGRIFNEKRYIDSAYKILKYYKENHYDEIMNFGFLSHFYAYVMEALVDMGEYEMAKEAMVKIAKLQKENGAVPAYYNVDWVCSTGLFQFALVWFRLGEIERGNKAFEYACKLQNESGGWYGSYLSEINKEEDNTYFAVNEISWAVKYFLDALYYKNLSEFNLWADSFLERIDKTDGRYMVVKNSIKEIKDATTRSIKVLDVGCGKGRYLKNLVEDIPLCEYYAVDISKSVLEYIGLDNIEVAEGTLTNINYPNDYFDVVYTCEALEHAIDIDNAIKEMARVSKPGGKMIVVDKNIEELGRLEICEWETWFKAEELAAKMKIYCDDVKIVDKIAYEDKKDDNLFLAWIGTVKKD